MINIIHSSPIYPSFTKHSLSNYYMPSTTLRILVRSLPLKNWIIIILYQRVWHQFLKVNSLSGLRQDSFAQQKYKFVHLPTCRFLYIHVCICVLLWIILEFYLQSLHIWYTHTHIHKCIHWCIYTQSMYTHMYISIFSHATKVCHPLIVINSIYSSVPLTDSQDSRPH